MSKQNEEMKEIIKPDRWDWIPMVLRNVAGFDSCITVAVTSVIFMVTIRDAVLSSTIGWFDGSTIALMILGPVVITWHFTNARGMIEKVLKTEHQEEEDFKEHHCTPSGEVKVPQNSSIVNESDVAIERQIFGLSTVMMRAVAGCFAAHCICLGSLIYTMTIRSVVLANGKMPDDTAVFLAIVGPIVTSWSFMRAANTISVLMSSSSALLKIRQKLAEIIAPKAA